MFIYIYIIIMYIKIHQYRGKNYSGHLGQVNLESPYHGWFTSQNSQAHLIPKEKSFTRPGYSFIFADHCLMITGNRLRHAKKVKTDHAWSANWQWQRKSKLEDKQYETTTYTRVNKVRNMCNLRVVPKFTIYHNLHTPNNPNVTISYTYKQERKLLAQLFSPLSTQPSSPSSQTPFFLQLYYSIEHLS